MSAVQVRNLMNKELRSLELSDKVFAYPAKPHLVYEAVCHFRAVARAGTHSTRNRVDVAGGGRKPYRQKKTGRARAGSRETTTSYPVAPAIGAQSICAIAPPLTRTSITSPGSAAIACPPINSTTRLNTIPMRVMNALPSAASIIRDLGPPTGLCRMRAGGWRPSFS